MMRKLTFGFLFVVLCLITAGCTSLIEKGALYLYGRSDVAITHYDLELDIRDIGSTEANRRALEVDFAATLTVQALKNNVGSMYFFLDEGFELKDVTINGQRAKFSKWQIPSGLLSVWWVDFPKKLAKDAVTQVTISYTHRVESLYNLPEIHYNTAMAWYPSMLRENLYTFSLEATLPAGLTPIAPAELVEAQTQQDQRMGYRFESTIPSPLIHFLALRVEKSTFEYPDGEPVHVYYPSRYEPAAAAIADTVRQVRRFYEQTFGPYNVESTSVVVVDSLWDVAYSSPYSVVVASNLVAVGMYSQNFSVLTHAIAHELAHYYWGYTTVPLLTEGWLLAEGLAEYSAKLFLQSRQETEALRLMQDNYANYLYIIEYLRSQGEKEMPLAKITFIYQDHFPLLTHKGVFVHQMAADLIGEENYKAVLKELYHRTRGGTISLQQWQDAIQKVSTQNLTWFFNSWVRGAGTVDFAINDVKTTGRQATVSITNQGNLQHRGPVEVLIQTTEETKTINVVLDKTQNTLKVDFQGQLQRIVIDPNWKLLDLRRENNHVQF